MSAAPGTSLLSTVTCTVLSPFVPGCAALLTLGQTGAQLAQPALDQAAQDARDAAAGASEEVASSGGGFFDSLTGAVHDVGSQTNEGLRTVLYTTITIGAIVALLVFAFIVFLVWHEFIR